MDVLAENVVNLEYETETDSFNAAENIQCNLTNLKSEQEDVNKIDFKGFEESSAHPLVAQYKGVLNETPNLEFEFCIQEETNEILDENLNDFKGFDENSVYPSSVKFRQEVFKETDNTKMEVC